jgi:hypothetical protein
MNLSEREIKVLAGLAEGLCIVEISQRMGLSKRTISYSISAVKQRLGNPAMNLRSLIARSSEAAKFPVFAWRLSESGQLVRSPIAAVRASLGLLPK